MPEHLTQQIRVSKVGSIWHGTVDGYPEIDERGLTEAIARRKVEEIVKQLEKKSAASKPV